MANVAYIRVSTIEQNEERQKQALKNKNIDKWFIDKCSGKTKNRPQLNACLDYMREGDTLYIHDLSRLARNTKDLLEIVEKLDKEGIKLFSNKESIDTSTATGKLFLTMVGAIAEFERENLLERQREGIALAQKKGKYKGRKIKKYDLDKFKRLYDIYYMRGISKITFAEKMGVSRTTLYQLMDEYEKGDFKHFNYDPAPKNAVFYSMTEEEYKKEQELIKQEEEQELNQNAKS